MAIDWLDAPGPILPVSSDPSFSTTRCVMLSMLCHTTIWPAGRVAGFGEKDCAPLTPMTLIVTTPPGGGVGVGVGVGVGAVGGGVGETGVAPPESVELPQPQPLRLNATITLATNTRML